MSNDIRIIADAERLVDANCQIRHLEDEYILPCFDYAAKIGFDLHAAVREAKGNCVIRFAEHTISRIAALEAENAKLRASIQSEISDPISVGEMAIPCLGCGRPIKSGAIWCSSDCRNSRVRIKWVPE